jgi:hypothetical protein
MSTSQNLDHTERAGTIHWWVGFSKTECRGMEGHFMLALDGHTVIARKKYGRNRWLLCDVADIQSFKAQDKKGHNS